MDAANPPIDPVQAHVVFLAREQLPTHRRQPHCTAGRRALTVADRKQGRLS